MSSKSSKSSVAEDQNSSRSDNLSESRKSSAVVSQSCSKNENSDSLLDGAQGGQGLLNGGGGANAGQQQHTKSF